ncbi:cytochrome b5 [Lineolata rhizophorae]|uniref:Cytochrome b5 n=1 Tax=Lineolata rhizophorae TaxID=578093 RepID=A0A6A6NQI5_9PEZI|nr:cytochrome b5 [Lineolata rhizophorae]
MSDKQYTYSDVAEHKTKKDLWVVIHDKVYNVSSFIDEHPGGEEVLLDVSGQDATEAFEDVGHSDEAREILEKLQAGVLKRQPGDPAPKAGDPSAAGAKPGPQGSAAGFGVGLYAIILVGGALAFGAYQFLQAKQQHEQ